jgi:lipopolysaccharide/colanic/teichoic acid biosynthesis glycosyltransferase
VNAPIPDHVQQFGTDRRDGRVRFGALIRSNRFTVGVALLLAIVIPELFHPAFNPGLEWVNPLIRIEPSLLISALCLLGAHVALRKIGILPLVDDKMLILPVFLTSYAFGYGMLLVSLRTFSLYHLVTSLVIGVYWYIIVALLRARLSFPRLAIVSSLPNDSLLLTSRIEWAVLPRPRLPHNVLGIVFDKDGDRAPEWDRLFTRAVLRNIPVYEVSRLREMLSGRIRLQSRPEELFGDLRPANSYLRLKRLVDTAAAVAALVVVVPLLAVLCLWIRLDSQGSPIFRQTRVGYQGRQFTCYKLRTMHVDSSGPDYTALGDVRITRAGRFLRKWRLDELPQIFNILKGEMSWIGPRPEAVSLARRYEKMISHYAYRHAVRPGISGWAAVHQGNVGHPDEIVIKLEYDFYYLKNFSIWLDFLIVMMSVRTIVTGFGHR